MSPCMTVLLLALDKHQEPNLKIQSACISQCKQAMAGAQLSSEFERCNLSPTFFTQINKTMNAVQLLIFENSCPCLCLFPLLIKRDVCLLLLSILLPIVGNHGLTKKQTNKKKGEYYQAGTDHTGLRLCGSNQVGVQKLIVYLFYPTKGLTQHH